MAGSAHAAPEPNRMRTQVKANWRVKNQQYCEGAGMGGGRGIAAASEIQAAVREAAHCVQAVRQQATVLQTVAPAAAHLDGPVGPVAQAMHLRAKAGQGEHKRTINKAAGYGRKGPVTTGSEPKPGCWSQ